MSTVMVYVSPENKRPASSLCRCSGWNLPPAPALLSTERCWCQPHPDLLFALMASPPEFCDRCEERLAPASLLYDLCSVW